MKFNAIQNHSHVAHCISQQENALHTVCGIKYQKRRYQSSHLPYYFFLFLISF